MRKVCKNQEKRVAAYRLGEGSEMERKLIREGKIRRREDGSYELFSREARGEKGEEAQPGDYFKVDSGGYPYPNAAAWFCENHSQVGENLYMQHPRIRTAWRAGDPMTSEIRFLLEQGRLTLHEDQPEQYFEAFLFQTELTAPKDAWLVIYGTQRDEQGNIQDIEFNFVTADEFDRTYAVVG